MAPANITITIAGKPVGSIGFGTMSKLDVRWGSRRRVPPAGRPARGGTARWAPAGWFGPVPDAGRRPAGRRLPAPLPAVPAGGVGAQRRAGRGRRGGGTPGGCGPYGRCGGPVPGSGEEAFEQMNLILGFWQCSLPDGCSIGGMQRVDSLRASRWDNSYRRDFGGCADVDYIIPKACAHLSGCLGESMDIKWKRYAPTIQICLTVF